MLWHLPLCTTTQITSEEGLSLIYTFSSACSYVCSCEYLERWKLHTVCYCHFLCWRSPVCCAFLANKSRLSYCLRTSISPRQSRRFCGHFISCCTGDVSSTLKLRAVIVASVLHSRPYILTFLILGARNRIYVTILLTESNNVQIYIHSGSLHFL